MIYEKTVELDNKWYKIEVLEIDTYLSQSSKLFVVLKHQLQDQEVRNTQLDSIWAKQSAAIERAVYHSGVPTGLPCNIPFIESYLDLLRHERKQIDDLYESEVQKQSFINPL